MSYEIKITSLPQLYEALPEEERIIVDVLRLIILQALPLDFKEKLSFNVPFFYRRRGVCIIWPASIKGVGIKEGVLLGFWHGNRLQDTDKYLTKGSNKRIYYKIYTSVKDIDETAITKLLVEAVNFDKQIR